MTKFLLRLAALAAITAPMAAQAAPCRDAHGRFVSCAAAHHAAVRRERAIEHHAAVRREVAMEHRAAALPIRHPVARAAPRHCKIGNRFASCAAPGARPA